MSDLISGLESLNKALPGYEQAEQYYEGTVEEIFSSAAVKKALGKTNTSFVFNYARIVVTSRLNRMEIASVTADNEAADPALAEVWNHNALDQEIQDALEAALIFGDSYLIAWPDEDNTTVDVFYNDPRNTRVFYDVENPRKKSYAIKRWNLGDKLRVNLYYEDRIEKYISKKKVSASMKDGDFEQYLEEGQEAWPLANDTGAIPVFHLRTSRMYGTPEHKAAFGPQNAINKLLSTQVSSIDFTSFPQRYFLEDPTTTDNVNPADMFGTADTDDDDSVTSKLTSSPASVWHLKNVKSVGQFDVASPDTFVTPFKSYVDSLSTTTQTPIHLFQVGALPSGESLRAAEAPLNKRVESLELLFGGVIADLHEYALDVLGFEGTEVVVTWAPVATYDDTDVWATVDAKTSAGVPLTTALKEAGYTQAQIEEWYPEEDGTPRSAAVLGSLSEAIQKIAAAVSLGLISKEEARNLLPKDILIEGELADPNAVLEALAEAPAASESDDIKSKAEAMGILIRAGVASEDAAERVGLAGVEFTGAMPTSLRLPEAEAKKLEEA